MKNLYIVLLLTLLTSGHAFTQKKHETKRRPAFSTTPMKMKEEPSIPSTSNTAALAVAPTLSHEDEVMDEDIVIGYGTALISCALSLALGFGLGYGT